MKTTHPLWIDDDSEIPDPLGHGEKAVQFLRNLKHPKSRLPGHAFQLDRWMERVIRRIYGPRHPDGTRIVKTVFAMIPRGNRKTSLGAALTLLHSIGPEKTPGGQVVCAAADQKQARIAFEEAVGIIRSHKTINRVVDIIDHRNRFRDQRSGSLVEAISADAKTQHGRTPSFTLMDEIHAWPKRDLWEALKTGLVKTAGSLNVIITTAGRGQENIAFEQYSYARKVALGEIDDPATLPVIFEAPADCDWQDETIWHRVNPGLKHGYPDLDGLRQLAREGRERPGDRDSFKQLNLNIWSDSSSSPFVGMDIYDEGADPINLDALAGQPCWLGVDLSSNTDLTVIVAAWRDGTGGYIVHPWFYCPRMNLQERTDITGAAYIQWERDGFITATQGEVIDFRAVEVGIRDLCDRFNVQEICFDPALARNVVNNLLDDGLPAVTMRQGPITMMDPMIELERAIVARQVQHGGHPALRFCFSNVEVERNAKGQAIRFVKPKRWLSLDGVVATTMAVARAFHGDDGRSVYDDPNFKVEDWLLDSNFDVSEWVP
ncbi:phage Terminase [Nitrobacter hamburgensis X14]|uniref:Phage Terminase n=1 Tax=Nitrobacter hamburgensis (strain DSM 10229 / NCIMB 13809 / X14) TaxID=323097 RepID=Q1QKH7_NITHX|nr:phage Terminase [Nitrobacter hamburgensis X14]